MKTLLAALAVLLSTTGFAQDPLFGRQWSLANRGQPLFRVTGDLTRQNIPGLPGIDMGWPGVLVAPPGAPDVVIAILDSGIDPGHPEFAGRLVPGKDFLNPQATVMGDDMGHGTHVAGIIAANLDGQGTQGITPTQVKIMPLKVLSTLVTGFIFNNRVFTDIVADALIHAIDNRVAVINLSLGWPQIINTPRVVRALDVAHERGIVVVAAAGNNNKDVPTWPCSHPTVICVGAIDNRGDLTEFTNHGGRVDIVAPGEGIISTIPRMLESSVLRIAGYDVKNGSSQAAPMVAAAVALIKLQNPAATPAEIKARLFVTAKPLPQANVARYVRYGLLDIAGALAAQNLSYATVSVKNLASVVLEADGDFEFTLPLERYNAPGMPTVRLQGLEAEVEVRAEVVLIRGKWSDLSTDSERQVVFHTTLNGRTRSASVSLTFARKLRQGDLLRTAIPAPAADVVMIRGSLRQARLGHVSVENRPSSDLHYYTSKRDGEAVIVTSLRANAGEASARAVEVKLPQHAQLMAVFEKDVNQDGHNDLVFYGMHTDRRQLLLTFTDLAGRPLFGARSRWAMAITTFEGLPLKEERGDFSWLRIDSFLGPIVVPYFQRAWLLPTEDNSRSLMAHEPDGEVAPRLFYLEPVADGEGVKLRPRVVDSVAFKTRLNGELTRVPWESAVVERLLPQSADERLQGVVRHVVSTGEGFFRRLHILRLAKLGSQTLAPHADADPFQTGNNSYVTRSYVNGESRADSFQLALMDQSSARVKPFIEGSTTAVWSLTTGAWSNPFFEVVDAFAKDGERVFFFEARYHLYAWAQRGNEAPRATRLPINRDSSIPGVQFSETLQSTLVKIRGENHPAVVVNATSLFGDRLYTMVHAEEGLVRAAALSVQIPPDCVPLRTVHLTTIGSGGYVMVCRKADGSAELGVWPLELE